MTKIVKITEIVIDPRLQIRVDKQPTLYAQDWKEGVRFPPVHVFQLNGTYVLVDGWHRIEAAKEAGDKTIVVEVHVGSLESATKFALIANATHGIPRTLADKKNAISVALENFRKMSDGAIADMCGVSLRTVQRVVAEKKAQEIPTRQNLPTTMAQPAQEKSGKSLAKSQLASPVPTTRIGRDGKSYSVKEKEQKGPTDSTDLNYPIPEPALPAWNRRGEVQELLTTLTRLKTACMEKLEAQDQLWREVSSQTLESALINAYNQIKRALPYAVCPSCQGQLPDACTTCWGRGMISEFAWKSQTMEELRTLRAKSMRAVEA